MIRTTAIKLVIPVCSVAFLVALATSARQIAKIEKSDAVVQGSTIKFQITTNRPANIAGYVAVEVGPSGGGTPVWSSGFPLQDKTVLVGLTMPVDAKTGEWKVIKVTFAPAPNGHAVDLAAEGDLTFEVISHKHLDLPSTAQVEIR